MNKGIINILIGLKYFIFQTLLETMCIITLMYLGLKYSFLEVGGEEWWEVIIGVLGYHALFKSIIYILPYLVLFILAGYILRPKKRIIYGIINFVLSIALPIIILILRELTIEEMLSVFIGTLLSSILIILFDWKSKKPAAGIQNLKNNKK